VLRNFMADRVTQVTLGIMVGVFAYCLVVLRTIRGGDEGAFVPSLAALGAVVFAFVAIGILIYFIHHIASSIQASHILAAVTAETLSAIDHLFPEPVGEGLDGISCPEAEALSASVWGTVVAGRTGYLQRVDSDRLIKFACEHGRVLRMECGIGDFVIRDTPLLSVTAGKALEDSDKKHLNSLFTISRRRTVEQDAGFGIRQIVDVALKALSPGVNDTTTAVMCVDYLTAILVRLAGRQMESPCRMAGDQLRVIARAPSFASLTNEALDQIRQNAVGNTAVLHRLLRCLEVVAGVTDQPARRRVLTRQLEAVRDLVRHSVKSPTDLPELESYGEHVSRAVCG
jgi:uncharacterized membrane protein